MASAKSFLKLFQFLRFFRVFNEKIEEPYCLLVIDGPTSISTSMQILNDNKVFKFRCIGSAHFITRLTQQDVWLKQYMVGWSLSTVIKGLYNYLSTYKITRWFNEVAQIRAAINAECIVGHISHNAKMINAVVVFNERNNFPALAISTASNHGIVTACIQHGAVVKNYFPINVDWYFTWSDYYSDLLRRHVPRLKTASVGRLGFNKPVILPNSPKLHNILLVLQPADVSISRNHLLSHFYEIIDISYSFFDKITIRPHPSDNILGDIVKHIGDRKYFVDSGQINDSLSRHELVVSIYSTVLLEAPYFGCLPIQYIEAKSDNELMQRCELLANNRTELNVIFTELRDKAYFSGCLNRAIKFSSVRMQESDNDVFRDALSSVIL